MSKITLVTGAAGYIGGFTAKTLAKRGDYVYVCDINLDKANTVVNEILANGGKATALVADVTDSNSVKNAFDIIIKESGRIDVVVHGAGGSAGLAGKDKYHNLSEQSDDVIDKVFKVNLYGAMYVCREAARQMTEQGDGGKIVIISSAIGLNGYNGKTEYAVAKGGVITLARSLAKEVGRYGITVNTVAPGSVGNVWVTDDQLMDSSFLNIRGTAQDIANAVEFVASDKARFITGQTIAVDGGRSLALKGTD